MNKAEMVQTLEAAHGRKLAETMVTDFERMGWRHHNGRPVTAESIRRICRPTRLAIKAQRNAGRHIRSATIMAAKLRYSHGIS